MIKFKLVTNRQLSETLELLTDIHVRELYRLRNSATHHTTPTDLGLRFVFNDQIARKERACKAALLYIQIKRNLF